MQIGPVYAVISVVEANMVIRGHLGRPALLISVVAAAVRLLGEGRIVVFFQMLPKVTVELLCEQKNITPHALAKEAGILIPKQISIEASICEKMLNLISDKYVYASPSLIKLAYALINTEKFETTVESAERRRIFELHLKKEIVRIILKDYYWLREQLHLQENIDESGKVETGNFVSI